MFESSRFKVLLLAAIAACSEPPETPERSRPACSVAAFDRGEALPSGCCQELAQSYRDSRDEGRAAFIRASQNAQGEECQRFAQELLRRDHVRPSDLLAAQCQVTRVAILDGQGADGLRIRIDRSGACTAQATQRGSLVVLRTERLHLGEEIPEHLDLRHPTASSLRFNEQSIALQVKDDAVAAVHDLGDRWIIDVALPAARRAEPLIVLDPGHGADDFGTRLEGLDESKLVLDIAERAAPRIASRVRGARVVLTRTRDVFVPLEERSALANALGADVFVSLHLNAGDGPIRVGGMTTFVLDTSRDAQATRLAARENGVALGRVGPVSQLLASVHRETQVQTSMRLAELVQAHGMRQARSLLPSLTDRGVKRAGFHVLVGARMPAVLWEASFLTTPGEGHALRTAQYRDKLAEGLAAAVAAFFEHASENPSSH